MFQRHDQGQGPRPFASTHRGLRRPSNDGPTGTGAQRTARSLGAERATDLASQFQVVPPPAPPATVVPFVGNSHRLEAVRRDVQRRLMEVIDMSETARMDRAELEAEILTASGEISRALNLELSRAEEDQLKELMIHDMLGLGPIEPLVQDQTVTDVLVNGPNQVYVERRGRLELTDVSFRDKQHVLTIAMRICAKVHRRIDEANPLVDARLEDGSRVNIIIPPLALDGPFISIRKFSKRPITLDKMVEGGNMSAAMAEVLAIASTCRLNIIVSGGTGAGKTTLLNALSRMIDHGERIVTIEDAAELQLQQPHVLRHETRPANIEGEGEVTMRDLVRNALRMRPDRIILGEARGAEAFDMLQAMNTGHDGSMCTIHANRPREALSRLENMICMSGIALPGKAIRQQISDAINLIVQIKRCRDGIRRVVSIAEVVGMEHDVITTQELFTYEYEGMGADGRLMGDWHCSGVLPYFHQRARDFDLGDRLRDVMCGSTAPKSKP